MNLRRGPQSGFTLIEIIIVIAIIAFVYTIAMPSFNTKSSTEIASILGRLNADIRAAFDLAILRGKPCRMVFQFKTGSYWLETTDADDVYLGNAKLLSDPTQEEEEEKREEWESEFAQYKELGEKSYTDPASDDPILTTSPVLEAKDKLKGPKWTKFDSLEWGTRNIGGGLGFRSIRTEHHERAVTIEDTGEDAHAYLYFLPQGYVEKAVIFIFYRLDEKTLDMETNPYRISTKPYEGEGVIDAVSKDAVNINDFDEDDRG